MQIKYDYIICGAGAAGLSLALRLADDSFDHLNILIIDKEIKRGNDHTWCFWEEKASPYDHILTNSYDNVYFHSTDHSQKKSVAPYRYKMLQSAPFYDFVWQKIQQHPNIHFVNDTVLNIAEQEESVTVYGSESAHHSSYVFTSIFQGSINKGHHLYVDQHFKGWFISCEEDVFDPGTATFMDFRIDQAGDCRFFYVLPWNKREALVEIAIFSNELLGQSDYDPLIDKYISDYIGDVRYEIKEKEYGVIPMTTYPFWDHATNRIFPVGTAGGAVKPSSGFAFRRIQQHSERIIDAIASGKDMKTTYSEFSNRFYLYDKILLDVMLKQQRSGADIFTHLFSNNPSKSIFKFLDGETSLSEEIRLFATLPTLPFLRGWFRQKLKI